MTLGRWRSTMRSRAASRRQSRMDRGVAASGMRAKASLSCPTSRPLTSAVAKADPGARAAIDLIIDAPKVETPGSSPGVVVTQTTVARSRIEIAMNAEAEMQLILVA